VAALQNTAGDRAINWSSLWPTSLPDPIPHDHHLWGMSKNSVYNTTHTHTHTHTKEDLAERNGTQYQPLLDNRAK